VFTVLIVRVPAAGVDAKFPASCLIGQANCPRNNRF
jgi:hypothetical protein